MTSSARTFVKHGLDAVAQGHYAAAQSLFTNTLDTVHQATMTRTDFRTILSHKIGKGPQALDLELREAYVMLPLWRSYDSYWANNGDPVPATYSRHASVHGVSARQYSKRNTVHALMLVASYLGFIEGF